MKCYNCDNYYCRCDSCFALCEDVDDSWYCDEYQRPCRLIDECHEFAEDEGCDLEERS